MPNQKITGHYITDHLTSVKDVNEAFESLLVGSTFNCIPIDETFYSEGKGITTEDFFIGNFITHQAERIYIENMQDCVLSMPRSGNFEIRVGNEKIRAKAQTTGGFLSGIKNADYVAKTKVINDYLVIIRQEDLKKMMDKQFGIKGSADVFHELRLDSEKVRALFNYVGSTINLMETFDSLRDSLMAKMNIKEISMLMVADILGDILQKKRFLDESPEERLVIKAEEIMDSFCEDISTIQEIADKVFTSPRNLQRAFKKYRDYTPIQFLRGRKLNRANLIFKDGHNSASVKEVAIQVGLFDLNRFGKYYFEEFGEYPSETLTVQSKA